MFVLKFIKIFYELLIGNGLMAMLILEKLITSTRQYFQNGKELM